MPKCVILLSGGLDSTTCLYEALSLSYEPVALTVQYGQRHALEVEAAKKVAQQAGIRDHRFASVSLDVIGGSALTDNIGVPKSRSNAEMQDGIPVTYVPARNTVFLSLALGLAEVVGASDIFVGVNAVDYSGYPDCRPEFIRAFEQMARLATKAGVEGKPMRVHAPLIGLTKAQIIEMGMRLGVDYSSTLSCYDPGSNGAPCLECDACQLRAKGFAEAGIKDPALAK